MKSISTKGMSRTDWLTNRRSGIGGSDIGVLLDVNKYKTPLQLFNEKTMGLHDDSENPATEFGLRLEGVVAKKFSEVHKCKVLEDFKIRFHPETDFFLCNIDRMVRPTKDSVDLPVGKGQGILSIKTASQYSRKNWGESIPPSYYAQIQWELFVTGLEWEMLALLVDGRYYEEFGPFFRNEEFIENARKVGFQFWTEHAQVEIPPAPQLMDIEAMETVVAPIEVTTDILSQVRELKAQQVIKSQAESEEKKLKEALKFFMGEYDTLTRDGEVVATYKRISKKEFVSPAKSYRELRIK
jgi:putative phage-type endonuclease